MKERTGKYGLFYGCISYPDCKFTFPLRIKTKEKKKKSVKKLVLPKGYGFNITGDDILGVLSNKGKNKRQLIKMLKITDETDVKYLQLKLKEFERKGLIVKNAIDNEVFWKKNAN